MPVVVRIGRNLDGVEAEWNNPGETVAVVRSFHTPPRYVIFDRHAKGMQWLKATGPNDFDDRSDAIAEARRSRYVDRDPRRGVRGHAKRSTISSRDNGDRPAEVTRVAREIYDHTVKDRLLRAVERLGWDLIREVPSSGAWWIRKGDHEVMITFGGPRQQARAFSWRPVGGAAERI